MAIACWVGSAVVAAVLQAGCATQSDIQKLPVDAQIIKSSVRYQKQYLLTAGDQIEVSVWRSPEATRTVTVRPDGFISLPLLQDVKAAGLTPAELAGSVRDKLSSRLNNPEVTVIPQQIRPPSVYVLGDVKAPGAFPFRNATTAVQAIALAGGALRSAAEQSVTIIRLSSEGYLEAIPVITDSYTQPAPYMTLAAMLLEPDDIVFVPESGRAQVLRVMQDVLTPLQVYLNYKLITSLI